MTPSPAELAHEEIESLLRGGQLREAETLCRRVLKQSPDDAIALHQLGMLATAAGRFEPAVELLSRAASLLPQNAAVRVSLSIPLIQLGCRREAIDHLRQAIRFAPNHGPAHGNLGILLCEEGNYAEAQRVLARAVELQPTELTSYTNMALAHRSSGQVDEAIEWYQRALAINPNAAQVHGALGSCLREMGRIGEAISELRRAVELEANDQNAWHNLLYALNFDPNTSPSETFAMHRQWAQRFADPLTAQAPPHGNDRSPSRRLRIGYVSPDLRNHVVGLFMEPILENHDRGEFEVFCYADVPEGDAVSDRLRQSADTWRMTARLSDQQLAHQIRDDRIDVLIDLTLHMRGSRLLAFARKPAPMQITHLAYCGTSGMAAMDGCITDRHLSPPGLHEQWFTEERLRLADSYWCYRPSPTSPTVGSLPAQSRGYITLGSLNSLAKVNDRVILTWARILQAIPTARLMVHAPGNDANRSTRERFTRAGIASDRLTLVGNQSHDDYLDLYTSIDIALDPFPYGGGTTSLDALWMGVPVVTLAGVMPVSRSGVTLLKNLELEDLIAITEEQYVQKVTALSENLGSLAELRLRLRGRLEHSPLTDAPRYARSLEAAYRGAWTRWCCGPWAGVER